MTPAGLPGNSQTFGYTALEQVKSATSGSATASYAYDAGRDPTTNAGSSQAFDASHQLCWTLPSGSSAASCANTPTGATAYTYNSRGDRAGTSPASGTASTYTYDLNNQLTSYTGPGGNESYTYSGDGLRASKTIGSTKYTLTWDDAKIPNLLSDGSIGYVYGPDGPPIEQIISSGSQWYFHDALGSTVALFNGSGAISGAYSYDSYGNVSGYTGTTTTPLQYAAGYTDAETGFVYVRARYYDPATAEFITVDPAVASTQAAYTHGSDDPLNMSDPTGLCSFVAMVNGGYRPGKQTPPQLTDDEQQALDNKNAGLPYDKKAYNSAVKKLKQGGKYTAEVNKQKRANNNKQKRGGNSGDSGNQSNFSFNVPNIVQDIVIAVAVVVVAFIIATLVAPIVALFGLLLL